MAAAAAAAAGARARGHEGSNLMRLCAYLVRHRRGDGCTGCNHRPQPTTAAAPGPSQGTPAHVSPSNLGQYLPNDVCDELKVACSGVGCDDCRQQCIVQMATKAARHGVHKRLFRGSYVHIDEILTSCAGAGAPGEHHGDRARLCCAVLTAAAGAAVGSGAAVPRCTRPMQRAFVHQTYGAAAGARSTCR